MEGLTSFGKRQEYTMVDLNHKSRNPSELAKEMEDNIRRDIVGREMTADNIQAVLEKYLIDSYSNAWIELQMKHRNIF